MKITAQQFDELKQQTDLAAVLKAVGVEVEDEAWPKDSDMYFPVDADGVIYTKVWRGDATDLFCQSLNNVHRTREDAEHYKATTIRRWQAEIAIRNWRDKHCPFEAEWENKGQQKWSNCFDYYAHQWGASGNTGIQRIGEIYFATEAAAKACLDALPEDWEVLRTVGG